MTDAAEGQVQVENAKLDGWDCMACILRIGRETGIHILSPIGEGDRRCKLTSASVLVCRVALD
jgi:hypothetical protein